MFLINSITIVTFLHMKTCIASVSSTEIEFPEGLKKIIFGKFYNGDLKQLLNDEEAQEISKTSDNPIIYTQKAMNSKIVSAIENVNRKRNNNISYDTYAEKHNLSNIYPNKYKNDNYMDYDENRRLNTNIPGTNKSHKMDINYHPDVPYRASLLPKNEPLNMDINYNANIPDIANFSIKSEAPNMDIKYNANLPYSTNVPIKNEPPNMDINHNANIPDGSDAHGTGNKPSNMDNNYNANIFYIANAPIKNELPNMDINYNANIPDIANFPIKNEPPNMDIKYNANFLHSTNVPIKNEPPNMDINYNANIPDSDNAPTENEHAIIDINDNVNIPPYSANNVPSISEPLDMGTSYDVNIPFKNNISPNTIPNNFPDITRNTYQIESILNMKADKQTDLRARKMDHGDFKSTDITNLPKNKHEDIRKTFEIHQFNNMKPEKNSYPKTRKMNLFFLNDKRTDFNNTSKNIKENIRKTYELYAINSMKAKENSYVNTKKMNHQNLDYKLTGVTNPPDNNITKNTHNNHKIDVINNMKEETQFSLNTKKINDIDLFYNSIDLTPIFSTKEYDPNRFKTQDRATNLGTNTLMNSNKLSIAYPPSITTRGKTENSYTTISTTDNNNEYTSNMVSKKTTRKSYYESYMLRKRSQKRKTTTFNFNENVPVVQVDEFDIGTLIPNEKTSSFTPETTSSIHKKQYLIFDSVEPGDITETTNTPLEIAEVINAHDDTITNINEKTLIQDLKASNKIFKPKFLKVETIDNQVKYSIVENNDTNGETREIIANNNIINEKLVQSRKDFHRIKSFLDKLKDIQNPEILKYSYNNNPGIYLLGHHPAGNFSVDDMAGAYSVADKFFTIAQKGISAMLTPGKK